MGRTIMSVRLQVNRLADRWRRVVRKLRPKERDCGEVLIWFAKRHSSEAFIALSDPVEAAFFSAMVEIQKLQDRNRSERENGDGGSRTQAE